MEYKKNRQTVILQALRLIKPQSAGQLNIPSFLKESTYRRTSLRLAREWDTLANRLLSRTEKLLESPGRYDPVYRILQRLFTSKSTCHLNRGNKIRHEIREKAQKRYTLGYPPRKPNDTSIGDSINWEWIIYCATQCHDDIVLISRDSDYGAYNKSNYYLNDWLRQEFKERVSHRRSITLTGLLSEGFKIAGITVPREEEQAEEVFIQYLRQKAADHLIDFDQLRNRLSHIRELFPDADLPDNILAASSSVPTSRNLIDDELPQSAQSRKESDKQSS